MSVLQLSPVKIGQTGVKPASYKMLSTENLAAVTTAGYIKQGEGGQFFSNNDLIEVILQYGTPSSSNALLSVSINASTNVITLSEVVPPGGVTVIGTPTTGHVATFASPTSIQDGGALGQAAFKAVSDNTKANVPSISLTPVVVGNIVNFGDTAGTIEDSNVAITAVQLKGSIKVANVLSGIGGTGVSYTVPVTGLLSTSIVVANLRVAGTNATAAVNAVVAAPGEFLITFTADPGAGSELSYIAFIAAQ
jgi:hypothetical protein